MLQDENTSPRSLASGSRLASHLILETHGRDVASHSSIFFVVTALRLRVEFAVRDRFLKARTVNFVEMNRTHALGEKRRKKKKRVLTFCPCYCVVKKYPITVH